MVSVGVLTTLGLLGLAGALALGNRGGPGHEVIGSGSASSDATRAPGSWTAATVLPEVGPVSAGAPSAGAAGQAVTAVPTAVPTADRLAGIATTRLVQVGTGRLVVVPGSAPAPTAAPRMTVRVEVEEGIGVDGSAFADFVMDTLNDSRGWGHGGTLSFARTSGAADFRVILASPDTSARLCAPEQTHGTASCGGGERAVLTMYRWMRGIPDYGNDRKAYRQYAINHEVGHVLGHSHAYCDPGHLAPVMVQQTKGLHGCLPNAWPFPVSS